MRNEQEANRAIELYSDTVKRICMVYLKNQFDTEDIFQTVFMKYVLYDGKFEDEKHEKAWIITVTINACKDFLRSFFRKNSVSLDEAILIETDTKEDYSEVFQAVLSLPKKYKDVVYLFYYEEYTAVEIGKILNKNVNTIYTLLSRARLLLKEKLGGDDFE
ncbi:MAG TPA: RNA polymerase subunit sigma-24 [Erysipelotrichaceae bacterium]|nr:RNA polymerase subunit sigma-24 [Erysipelotrichaceae bacterium]